MAAAPAPRRATETREQYFARLRAQPGGAPRGTDYMEQQAILQEKQLAQGGQDPRVKALIDSGGTGTVNKVIGDTDFRIENGKVVYLTTGGVKKPLLMAAAVAASGGAAGYYVAGAQAANAAAQATAAATAGTAAAPITATTAGVTTAGVGTGAKVIDEIIDVGSSSTGKDGVLGMSYAEMLKYGAPMVGNVVNGVIQNRAASSAAAEQQRYLEDALKYQKEQDAYIRGRDEEQTAYDRSTSATALAKEEGRYNSYQGRIGGFISNGQSSNDRMAQLLGLPARPAGSGGGGYSGGRGGAPVDTGDWESWFNSITGGRAPTPAELTALGPQLQAAGASLAPNAEGVNGKIRLPGGHVVDVIQGASGGGKAWQWLHDDIGQVTAAPIRAGAATNPSTSIQYLPGGRDPYTGQPLPPPIVPDVDPRKPKILRPDLPGAPQTLPPQRPTSQVPVPALVTVTAPNGQTKQVPASEADHWKARGATIQGAA